MTIPRGTSGGGTGTTPTLSTGSQGGTQLAFGNASGGYLRLQIIEAAAKQYGIPWPILYGVWGMETSFGSNVNTSSTGAVGDFQFEPSTAASYSYPLTNNPTDQQFGQQALAAAHYLHDLYAQTGSWNTALQHYSGGGYGLTQVSQQAQQGLNAPATAIGGAIQGAANTVTGDVASAATGAAQVAGVLGDIWTALTNPSHWLRALELIGGAAALYFGIKALTGSDSGPTINIGTAGGAIKTAAKVAEA